MLKQLRVKFICIIMAIVAVTLAVIFGFIYHSTRQDLEDQSIRMLQSVMGDRSQRGLRDLSELPAPPEQEESSPPADLPERLDQADRPLREADEVLLPYFTLQEGEDGTLTASGTSYYDLTDQSFLTELKAAADAAGGEIGVLSDYDLRFCVHNDLVGHFIAFGDISSERATLNSLLRTFAIVGIVSLIVFLGISVLLARWAVRPVERAWEQQRQFVADASHELKTPLTVITTNAELLKSPDCSDGERVRFTDSILTMSRQMRGLVEGLLELARADNGTAKMAFSAMNLSGLVDDALLPFEPVFFEKGLLLESDVEEGISVNGSEAYLKQVVDILLDNAQKYASTGANVTVTLKQTDKSHCLLTVANEGEPISPADLKNIFKRFYRVDKARSMNHSYGLGLSIAQSIVEQHGGKIWAESDGGWNRFMVRFGT